MMHNHKWSSIHDTQIQSNERNRLKSPGPNLQAACVFEEWYILIICIKLYILWLYMKMDDNGGSHLQVPDHGLRKVTPQQGPTQCSGLSG